MTATVVYESNCVSASYSFQGKPLNMGSATFSNNEVRTLGQLKAVVPCKGLIYVKLTSGALTYKVHVNTGTAAFGSAQVSRTISDTAEYANEFQVGASATDLYVDTQLTAGVAGCVIAKGRMRLEGLYPSTPNTGRGYHEGRFGWNTFTTAGGDYSTALT